MQGLFVNFENATAKEAKNKNTEKNIFMKSKRII
jgi:hypothetical protein